MNIPLTIALFGIGMLPTPPPSPPNPPYLLSFLPSVPPEILRSQPPTSPSSKSNLLVIVASSVLSGSIVMSVWYAYA